MNSTSCPSRHPLCFTDISFPFYYSPKPSLIHGIPDLILTLAAPVIAFWALSLFFHALDMSDWKWLDKYRIHDSAEVKARNLVSRSEVVWAVILQQVIQTALGIVALPHEPVPIANHAQELRRIALFVDSLVFATLGRQITPHILVYVASFLYWWGVPIFQFIAAMYEYLIHTSIDLG